MAYIPVSGTTAAPDSMGRARTGSIAFYLLIGATAIAIAIPFAIATAQMAPL